MIRFRQGYFQRVVAFHVLLFSTGYAILLGTGTVAFGITYWVVDASEGIKILEIIGVFITALFFSFFTAGFVSLFIGFILSFWNVISISIITYFFLQVNKFYKHKFAYCFLVILSFLVINFLSGRLLLNSLMLPIKQDILFSQIITEISLLLILLGALLSSIHYLKWFYDYIDEYSEFFDKKRHAISVSNISILPYPDQPYEMPPVPANLTQYADGELPAEILGKFPIGR